MKKQLLTLIAAAMCAGLAGCQGAKPQLKEGELYINEAETVNIVDNDVSISRVVEFDQFKENMGINLTSFVGKIPSEFSLTDFYSLGFPDESSDGYNFHDYVFEFDSESGKSLKLSVSPFGTPAYDTVIESDSPVHCTLNGATVTGYKLNESIYAFIHHGSLDYIVDAKGFTEDEFEALILSITSETDFSDVVLSRSDESVSNILSPADSEFFAELISDESRFVQTMPNCLMDCNLNVDGVEMQYHSDCGNLVRWDNGKCITLTEEEKIQLNEVFGKYITLGYEVVEEQKDVRVGNTTSGSDTPNTYVKPVSVEHSDIIVSVLADESRFVEGTADCMNDCIVAVNGDIFYYHSDCGTFNDNAKNRSFTLTESEKEEINGILSKYITIGSTVAVVEPFDPTGNYSQSGAPAEPIKDSEQPTEPEPIENAEPELIAEQPVVHYAWNVSFDVENISPTGLTVVCTQGGFDFGELITGEAYGLEVRDGYDWVAVKPIVDEVYWNELAYVITENATTSWTVNWEKLYGELPAGKYRIYKEISGPTSPDKTETQKYYVEFEIGSVPDPIIDDEWGIKFEASNVTPTGMTLGYMQYGGEHPDYEYHLEYPYWIEKFENGIWSEVPYASSDFEWVIPEIARPAINNSTYSSSLKWEHIYGELPAGRYRYCKEVVVYNAVDSEHKDGVHLKKPYYAEFEILDPWGVTLTAKNVTDESLTVVCEQKGGSDAKELLTGSYYTIEKLVNNSWNKVEYLPHEYDISWTAEAWIIPEDKSVEWHENWAWLYGVLEPGQYRIGKNITYWNGVGDSESKMYYAEFEISDPDKLAAEEWGVSLSVGDVTPAGLTVYLTQRGENPGEVLNFEGRKLTDMVTDMSYWLEYNILGEWRKVPYLRDDTVPTWSQMPEMIAMDATTNWKLEWKNYYGILPVEKYRIGKTVSVKLPSNDIQKFNVYAEFEISQYTKYTPAELGISAKAENVTSKGLDYVVTQTGDPLGFNKYNSRGFSTMSEHSYVLERYDGFSWTEVEPLKESYIYEYATPWVPLNTSTTIHIDWSKFYGELPAGKYRISKNFYFGISDRFESANFDVYAEFEIK